MGRNDAFCLTEKEPESMWSENRQVRKGLLLQALLM